jgi:hypothetical protein
MRSDLVVVAWAGPDHARIGQENRKLDALTARDRPRYCEDLARVTADEVAAQRACKDSSLAEAVECRRQEDGASSREQNRL